MVLDRSESKNPSFELELVEWKREDIRTQLESLTWPHTAYSMTGKFRAWKDYSPHCLRSLEQLPLKAVCVAILVLIPMIYHYPTAARVGFLKGWVGSCHSLLRSLQWDPITPEQNPKFHPSLQDWHGWASTPTLVFLEHVKHIPTQGLWTCCLLSLESSLPSVCMSHSLSSISSLFKSYPFREANSDCST